MEPCYKTNYELPEQIGRLEAQVAHLIKILEEQDSKDEVLTVSEACSFLKIPQGTLYKLTSQNRIPFFKTGKKLRFSRKALLEHLFYSKNLKK